jgi:hypothetical protein
MVPIKPSPRVALMRWLAQLHYNAIRNIESVFENVTRSDGSLTRGTALRGFQIADDLVLTRKRTFYKIVGNQAVPISVEEVSANYNLEALQAKYRAAVDAWKNIQRNRRR